MLVPQLDREHRDLIEQADRLRYKVGETPLSAIEARDLLEKLIDSIRAHFATEEELMLYSGYDAYLFHRGEHRKLLDQIYLVEKELASGKIEAGGGLASFLKAWLREHILRSDKPLAEFLISVAQHTAAKAKAAVAG